MSSFNRVFNKVFDETYDSLFIVAIFLFCLTISAGIFTYQNQDFNERVTKIDTTANEYLTKVEQSGMLTEIDKMSLQHNISELGLVAEVSGTTKRVHHGNKVYLDIKVSSGPIMFATDKDIFKVAKAS